VPHFEFLDHDGPIAFAHRGGALGGRENTMAAFTRAVDLGYRYLETDAHATADGVVVAFHDHTLDRVTDRSGRIDRLPYAEVARARVGGEPIPRLEELLAAWPEARFNIDVKARDAILPLVSVLTRAKAWHRVCIASFSTRRLASVRALGKAAADTEICTALGPRGIVALRGRTASGAKVSRLAGTGVACAQVPYALGPFPFVTPAFVARAHELGLVVHAWTVNDRAQMERLLAIGVDGIISDEIEALRDVMIARRRPWPA
jgi:glycerophosphoryl diester phosphodiesterase